MMEGTSIFDCLSGSFGDQRPGDLTFMSRALFQGKDESGTTYYLPAMREGYQPCWYLQHARLISFGSTGGWCDWHFAVVDLQIGLHWLLVHGWMPGCYFAEQRPQFVVQSELKRRSLVRRRFRADTPERIEALCCCPSHIASWKLPYPFWVQGKETCRLFHALRGDEPVILRRLESRTQPAYEDIVSLEDAAQMLFSAPQAWFSDWCTSLQREEEQRSAAA